MEIILYYFLISGFIVWTVVTFSGNLCRELLQERYEVIKPQLQIVALLFGWLVLPLSIIIFVDKNMNN